MSDFHGSPAVINLWATECGGCRAKLPAFVEIDIDRKGRIAASYIGVVDASDPEANLQRLLASETRARVVGGFSVEIVWPPPDGGLVDPGT